MTLWGMFQGNNGLLTFREHNFGPHRALSGSKNNPYASSCNILFLSLTRFPLLGYETNHSIKMGLF